MSDYSDETPDRDVMICQMAANLLGRCSQEIEQGSIGSSVDDLKIFIMLHEAAIKGMPALVSLLDSNMTVYIAKHGLPFKKEHKLITGSPRFDQHVIEDIKYAEQPTLPPIAAEDMLAIDAQIKESCRLNALRLAALDGKVRKECQNVYAVGQIVGARDSERRWWMARILFIFDDPKYPYPWYYVHFENWDDIHNEWISSPYRIKRFNPRRDILRR